MLINFFQTAMNTKYDYQISVEVSFKHLLIIVTSFMGIQNSLGINYSTIPSGWFPEANKLVMYFLSPLLLTLLDERGISN